MRATDTVALQALELGTAPKIIEELVGSMTGNYPVRTVFAILACHNRRSLSVRLVKGIVSAANFAQCRIEVVVFDDGSVDGTAEAIAEVHPDARILKGDGSAYWASSMSRAESYVLESLKPGDTDLLLWLNDDVELHEGAVALLLESHDGHPDAVVVGAVSDPLTGKTSYSGFRRYGMHALHLAKVDPRSEPLELDSLNGNVVLVPVRVARRMNGIDGSYSHAWADLDYGFRCRKAGIHLLLAPGYAGTCSPNPPSPQRDLVTEWKSFIGPKGAGNFRSLAKILRVQAPVSWPFQWATTYVLWSTRQIKRRTITALRAAGNGRD